MSKQTRYLHLMLLVLLITGIFLTSGAVAAESLEQSAQFEIPRLVVNTSFLNIRTGPGVQYSVLVTVVGGTELPVLGRATDNVWFQVSTVVGTGWVNVEFTIPRGSFDNVPVVSAISPFSSTNVSTPMTLGLPGDQGGGAAPASAPSQGGAQKFVLENGRTAIVYPGERFRAVINVEAVNLRTEPKDGATALGTLFRDNSFDFAVVGAAKDKTGVDWLALDVPDLGIGWVEAPKIFMRLSRVSGTVVSLTGTFSMTDSPNGSGLNLPVLTSGQEAFLVGISSDSNFVQIELGGGTRGWVPFSAVVTRTGTPTDEIDLVQLGSSSASTSSTDSAALSQTPAVAPSFGLATPHVVVNTGYLNIRSGPGSQYSTVATVPGGTELAALGVAPDRVWYLVQGGFGKGWLNIEFAVFRGSAESLPIIREAIGVLASPVAVISGSVSVYAAPGANFGVIGALTGPVEVPVVARSADGNWLQVNSLLGFGWVVTNQVVVRGDVSLVPIVG